MSQAEADLLSKEANNNYCGWDFRRQLIDQQLFGRKDIMWDFFCLQEIDETMALDLFPEQDYS